MKFSPFNPIRFGSVNHSLTDYEHIFATTDHILTEVFHDGNENIPPLELHDAYGDALIASLAWNTVSVGDGKSLSYYDLSGVEEGCYYLKFGDYESDCIHIMPISSLSDTVCFRYVQKNIKSRDDVLGVIRGSIRYYDYRIKGGFKDSDWQFGVENEQFVTQEGDLAEIKSIDYTDKVLTLGTSDGITPIEADIINRILTCPIVLIDGVRYARSGESVPEVRETVAGGKRAIYTVTLRESQFESQEIDDAITLKLRRTPDSYRKEPTKLRRIP